MATELGQAYVQIVPSARGISGAISKQLGPEADAAGSSAGQSLGGKLVGVMKGVIATAAIGKAIGASLMEGADLQQSLGGIETLFKGSASKVKKYADEAYRTTGLSANNYMESVTSFSASLLQSMGGDTEKAADKANMAMVDMSDNANKMGTNMGDIQNAYMGFAKQNYTMLDNLKLGYGGTKTEMERLLADATKLTGVKYDMSNLGDVYDAIHAVQEELDITGTTAKESAETFSGSLASMKASFSNVLGKLSLGQDIQPALKALAQSTSTFLIGNLVPMVVNIFKGLPGAIATFISESAPLIAKAFGNMFSGIGGGNLFSGFMANMKFATDLIKFDMKNMVLQVKDRIPEMVNSFKKLGTSLQPILTKVGGLLSTWAVGISEILSYAIPLAVDVLRITFDGIVKYVVPILDTVIDVFWEMSAAIMGAVEEYVVPALQQMIDWVRDNEESIKRLVPVVGSLVAGFMVFKTLSTIVPIITAVAATLKGLVTAFSMIKSAAGALTLIKTGFTALITAVGGPITIIIAAIAGLVAAFVYLWNTNEGFKNKVMEIWTAIQAFITPIINFIGQTIQAVWTGIATWWAENQAGILLTIQTVWNSIWTTISTVVGAISAFVMELFGVLSQWWTENQQTILSVATTVWNAVKMAIDLAMIAIQFVVSSVLNTIQSTWTTVSTAIKLVVQVMWAYVTTLFKNNLTSILTVVSAVLNQIKTTFDFIINTIKNIVKVGMSIMKGDWSGALDGIKGIIDGFKTFADKTWENIMNTAKKLVENGINSIKEFFGKLGDIDLFEAGKAIINGFIDGLKGAWEAGKDFIGGIGDWIKENKGPISYDKKLLIPAGIAIIGGLNSSIQDSFKAVMKTVSSMAGQIVESLSIEYPVVSSMIYDIKDLVSGNQNSSLFDGLEQFNDGHLDMQVAKEISISSQDLTLHNGSEDDMKVSLDTITSVLYQLLEKDTDILLDKESVVDKLKEPMSKTLAKMKNDAIRNAGLQPRPM
ncbi:hypothetical protein IGI37_002255 [Enterococcus sp. AZ194]|uniref:hypothetical protein n=1 Tax=Enterococcus sp. AZ194 TaxID=2774629 RepID=UPI003F22B0A9